MCLFWILNKQISLLWLFSLQREKVLFFNSLDILIFMPEEQRFEILSFNLFFLGDQ